MFHIKDHQEYLLPDSVFYIGTCVFGSKWNKTKQNNGICNLNFPNQSQTQNTDFNAFAYSGGLIGVLMSAELVHSAWTIGSN